MSLLLLALVLYLILLVGTVAYALLKGGVDERSGAITILVAALMTQVVAVIGPGGTMAPGWYGPEIGVMAVDVAVLVAFVAIAYRSTKFWPIWAAASQLVAVLTHWTVILDPSIVPMVYTTAQPFWAIPVIVALALGTRGHQRSLR
jgi:hypothetical protein